MLVEILILIAMGLVIYTNIQDVKTMKEFKRLMEGRKR